MGEYTEHALMEARQRVARCIGGRGEDLIFTASATEANNLALRGLVLHPKRRRSKILYTPTAHSSVLATLEALSNAPLAAPINAEPLCVDGSGQIDLDDARTKIDGNTLCVSLIDVNNETGVIDPGVAELTAYAHKQGALVHIDAVQGFARQGFSLAALPADLVVVSSGKIYGPKGAACLHIKGFDQGLIRMAPQLTGGGQEWGMRSSTPNLAAIRGFARATELACFDRRAYTAHMKELEETFLGELRKQCALEVIVHGGSSRVPGLMMIAVAGINAMKLLEDAQPLCLSAGSACRTLQATASQVLLSMGIPLDTALASFRISFGVPTTVVEVKSAAAILAQAVKKQ